MNAPSGFRSKLGKPPDGAKIQASSDVRDLTLWFVHSHEELMSRLERMKPHAASGRLWIIWRKHASGSAQSGLNQKTIRQAALDRGLVDFKISRIDDEWAGLRFTIRK